MKVYLFCLLSELELRLGNFIASHFSEDELLKMTFGQQYEDVKELYRADKETGNDVRFGEYLYLSNLLNISNCSPWEAAGVVSRCRLGTKCS